MRKLSIEISELKNNDNKIQIAVGPCGTCGSGGESIDGFGCTADDNYAEADLSVGCNDGTFDQCVSKKTGPDWSQTCVDDVAIGAAAGALSSKSVVGAITGGGAAALSCQMNSGHQASGGK